MREKLGAQERPTRRLSVRLGDKKDFEPIAGVVEAGDGIDQGRNDRDFAVERDKH